MAVLLGDNKTLVLDEAIPFEAGVAVALSRDASNATVVVILTEAVPEMVPSRYSIAVIVLV